jgi:hypothetical protein
MIESTQEANRALKDLDHKTTLTYTGKYWTSDGSQHGAENMDLEYVDEEREDLSAGLRGDVVLATQPNPKDGEENIVMVDTHDWITQACEQSGGHSLTTYELSEEPGDAIQVCTRCGEEVGN